MQTYVDPNIEILNRAVAQFTHHITAYSQTQNGQLKAAVADTNDPPAGAPDQSSLNDILNKVVQVPGTTSIATLPTDDLGSQNRMYQMLGNVRTLESYISVLTVYCIYNEHPKPYDITNPLEASLFTKATAKWRNYVITGGGVKAMAAYLPVSTILSQSFSKEVLSADIHLEFLTQVFGSFSFPEATLAELDGILTAIVSKLGDLKMSFEKQSDTMDHFLTYHYFSTVAGTGGDSGIPAMYDTNVRVFYLQVSQDSWKAVVSKNSINKLSFNMNYYDMNTTMNPDAVEKDQDSIASAIKQLTGKTQSEIDGIMNVKTIKADPKKE